jgi:hypothetical protein
MQHPGRVFSREQLLNAVWGSDVYVEARTVDAHIGRLRKALMSHGGADPIRTVRSAGYSLDEGGDANTTNTVIPRLVAGPICQPQGRREIGVSREAEPWVPWTSHGMTAVGMGQA